MAEFDPRLAQGLALAYRDADAEADRAYRYRVLVPDTAAGDTISAAAWLTTDLVVAPPPVTGLEARAGDGAIDLAWDRRPHHSGYHLERRRVGGPDDWTRLTGRPLVFSERYPRPYLYRDTVPNGGRVEYRVVGVDAFGREAEPSVAVEQYARDLTPPAPPYAIRAEKRDATVAIAWTNPPAEPDLAGYGVLRSTDPDTDYRPVHEELLPPGTTSYGDAPPGFGTYFYRLVAADTAGNVSVMSVRAMAVVEDTVAPPAPEGLAAVADTSGVVTLTWRHRPEPDVGGYRVYRMLPRGRLREFVPLTPGTLVDSIFTDTLPPQVRDRFVYRVRAVDFAGNHGEPSAEAAVRMPDRTPPVAPAILDHSVADRRVLLRFASPSGDVAAYEVRRHPEGAGAPDTVAATSAGVWADSTAVDGVFYRYEVVAVDSAGNRSAPSRPAGIRPVWPVPLAPPPPPRVRIDGAGRVVVEWAYPGTGGWSAIVYRRRRRAVPPALAADRRDVVRRRDGRAGRVRLRRALLPGRARRHVDRRARRHRRAGALTGSRAADCIAPGWRQRRAFSHTRDLHTTAPPPHAKFLAARRFTWYPAVYHRDQPRTPRPRPPRPGCRHGVRTPRRCEPAGCSTSNHGSRRSALHGPLQEG